MENQDDLDFFGFFQPQRDQRDLSQQADKKQKIVPREAFQRIIESRRQDKEQQDAGKQTGLGLFYAEDQEFAQMMTPDVGAGSLSVLLKRQGPAMYRSDFS
jgi:hypothetical protein